MITHALAAALNSTSNYKVGAACYDKKGRLLSVGYNKFKTHPIQHKWAVRAGHPMRTSLHAEIDALIKCQSRPYRMVVVRITKTGLAIAMPCPVCSLAIQEAGIREIMYTERDGKLTSKTL